MCTHRLLLRLYIYLSCRQHRKVNIVFLFKKRVEAILDSNFIIACVRKNIDFLSQLEEQGYRVLLPREVFHELRDLRLKLPHADRTAIDVALDLFEKRKVKKMRLGHENVDQGLITKGKQGAYIATLDVAIKRSVPHSIGILSAQQRVGVSE